MQHCNTFKAGFKSLPMDAKFFVYLYLLASAGGAIALGIIAIRGLL